MMETTVEVKFAILAVVVAVAAPSPLARLLRRGQRVLASLGRRPRALVVVALVSGALLPALGAWLVLWPEPSVHDEFAYLLMADTIVQGRVAMPPHEAWQHFETFHVLQQPTYAAKYMPATAAPLALAQVLFGDPTLGLWLQSAAMGAAVAWMLLGWLPGRWAAFGTLLFLVRFAVAGPWVQSFYGGAVAAIGGALVYGALPRLRRPRPPLAGSFALGLGLATLATSRPFVGLVASLPAAAVLVAEFVARLRHTGTRCALRDASRVALPSLGVLAATAAFMLHYNREITGDPLTLPYAAYDQQYAVYPPFLFQEPRPVPEYRHAVLEEFALGFQQGGHAGMGDGGWLPRHVWARMSKLGRDFVGIPGVVLLALLCLPRRRSPGPPRTPAGAAAPIALFVCGAVALALTSTTYCEGRYAAPIAAPLALLWATAIRRLAGLSPAPRRRAQAVAAAGIAVMAFVTAMQWIDRRPSPEAAFGHLRAGIREQLRATPGEDLVLVSYDDGLPVHQAWVYNPALLEEAPIIWARDMGAERNAELAELFPERTLWSLHTGVDIWERGVTLERVERE